MASSSVKPVDLRPKRSLINPDFDGYKLTLDSLPKYHIKLEAGLDIRKLSDRQYSLQHLKAFGVHNHLIQDPWNPEVIFYLDSNRQIWQLNISMETRNFTPLPVFQIPIQRSAECGDRVNVSMHFPSKDMVVLTDGAGGLNILITGPRFSMHKEWIQCDVDGIESSASPNCVVHSLLCSPESGGEALHCVLVTVDKHQDEHADAQPFITQIEWLSFTSQNQDRNVWKQTRRRTFENFSTPEYIALESDGSAIYFAGDKSSKFVFDSEKPIEEVMEATTSDPEYTFTWSQTAEDVSLQFPLADGIGKADIAVDISSDSITVGIKNGSIFLTGQLFSSIDVSASTWLIESNKLTIEMAKKESSTWPLVVTGNLLGKQVYSPEQESQMLDQLRQLSSDNPATASPEEMNKPVYNAQQLEECDGYREESAVMQRFHGDTHEMTHKVYLGSHQWLFNCQAEPGSPPSICLRHDVDGIVWQPVLADLPWEHVATFNALGYVQASKTNKKFAGCAPDYSFAVLCDCVRHLYIYEQPSSLSTDTSLRNRKTGCRINTVAKQRLLSIESSEDILGMAITNHCIAVVAGNSIHITTVKES